MAGRDIPDELIEIILKHLDLTNETDINRFRAVCQSWRSSIPRFERKILLPNRFEIESDSWTPCFLPSKTESIVYHITPLAEDPDRKQRGWLIRLDSDGKLVDPLSQTDYKGRTPFRPKVINFLDFRVFELARTYCSGHWNKMAVSENLDVPAVMMLRDKILYGGKLGLHVRDATKLYLNPDYPDGVALNRKTKTPVDDVIFYQGKFYAVSESGGAIVMVSSCNFKEVYVAWPICNLISCDKKMYLVESLGELLLVERRGPRFIGEGDLVDNVLNKEVIFMVYKLEERERWVRRWVKMKDSELSDRILFVADGIFSFSVSAKEFPGCRHY
ncbi:F-box protein SKIP23-like [Rosa rugosa]|uniref:F-box protein SKIP23-like n=1 Tax=Rosa rugosa TaxID=74645 RepID=UPI002B40D587|nr:F-box protein SKIP23-like [Rosa rugosa]